VSKQWFASNYVASIRHIERGDRPQFCSRGAFFDTWESAHVCLIDRLRGCVLALEKDLKAARGALDRAEKMKPPAEQREGAQ